MAILIIRIQISNQNLAQKISNPKHKKKPIKKKQWLKIAKMIKKLIKENIHNHFSQKKAF